MAINTGFYGLFPKTGPEGAFRRALAGFTAIGRRHDPEKCEAVLRKDHA